MIAIVKILFSLMLITNSNQKFVINDYLKAQLSEYQKIEFTIVSPASVDLSLISIDNSREFKHNGSFAYLPIKQKSNNGGYINSFLTLRLKLYKNVLVANRSLRKNEILNKSDFSLKSKEVSSLRFPPISSFDMLDKYRCRLKISEKSILQDGMIEKIPDIEIGDRVEALFISNSVSIGFTATSRSEGCVGNIIKVKSDDQRIFRAKVINNTTVKIIE